MAAQAEPVQEAKTEDLAEQGNFVAFVVITEKINFPLGRLGKVQFQVKAIFYRYSHKTLERQQFLIDGLIEAALAVPEGETTEV